MPISTSAQSSRAFRRFGRTDALVPGTMHTPRVNAIFAFVNAISRRRLRASTAAGCALATAKSRRASVAMSTIPRARSSADRGDHRLIELERICIDEARVSDLLDRAIPQTEG